MEKTPTTGSGRLSAKRTGSLWLAAATALSYGFVTRYYLPGIAPGLFVLWVLLGIWGVTRFVGGLTFGRLTQQLLVAAGVLAVGYGYWLPSDRFQYWRWCLALVAVWGALPVLGLLLAVRLAPAKCLALSVSIAFSFWATGAAQLRQPWGAPEAPSGHFSIGGTVRSDTRGYQPHPYSRVANFFVSNPSGYFCEDRSAAREPWRMWKLNLAADYSGSAAIQRLGVRQEVVRLRLELADADRPYQAAWQWGEVTLARGGLAKVRFSARADGPRPLTASLWADPPILGRQPAANRQVILRSTWQEFCLQVQLPDSVRRLTAGFSLAASTAACELRDVRLSVDGRRVEPPDKTTPYFVPYAHNSRGFRDREYAIPRPRGVWRIVVLGDSLIFGSGVRQQDTLPGRLADDLSRRRPGFESIEAVNCGFPGYSPSESLAAFRESALDYQPQLVLLSLFSNDNECLTPPAATGDSAGGQPPPTPPEGFFLDADWSRACGAIRELAEICRQREIRCGVFFYRYQPLDQDWRTMIEAIRPTLEAEQIPWIDLGEPLGARGMYEQLVHFTDAHPNARLQREAADLVAQFIVDHGLCEPPAAPLPGAPPSHADKSSPGASGP